MPPLSPKKKKSDTKREIKRTVERGFNQFIHTCKSRFLFTCVCISVYLYAHLPVCMYSFFYKYVCDRQLSECVRAQAHNLVWKMIFFFPALTTRKTIVSNKRRKRLQAGLLLINRHTDRIKIYFHNRPINRPPLSLRF